MRALSIFLLATSISFSIEASETSFINNLKKKEKIIVEHTSSGCFHYSRDIFIFNEGQVAIQEFKRENREYIKNDLGTLQLSKDDTQGLDLLFQAYAKLHSLRKNCTTIERIKIELFRDGELIRKKEFINGTCSFPKGNGIVTFRDLKQRIKPKHSTKTF